MKKIIKSFSFWFAIISIVIILVDLLGILNMEYLLTTFNPLIENTIYREPFRSYMLNNGPTIDLYSINFLTYLLYGLIIDGVEWSIKVIVKKSETNYNI